MKIDGGCHCGNQREQTFCPECGSGLYATSVGDGPKVYNIRAGTVRQHDQLVSRHSEFGSD